MLLFRTPRGAPIGHSALLLLILFAWASTPSSAAAQPGFAMHFEVGGALMMSDHQRDVLGYRHGFTGMIRPELRLTDALGIELSAGALWFPSDAGLGRVALAGGGLRIQPMLGHTARLVLDAHANYANTEGLHRFAVDTGVAFEFQASSHVGIGPYVRYTQVFTARPSDGADAKMLSYGLTFAVGPERRAARADGDGDGVLDDDDRCVGEHAGPTPDPARAGCPVRDADGDGVCDADDRCVDEAGDRTPDPSRLGCPLRDADHDGVLDADDQCPAEPSGALPDPRRLGCPHADADADGVYDRDDLCPVTAAGAQPDPNRMGCPDGDDDRDGFLNSVDVCPEQHANESFHPDPSRLGCALADRDHDTIPDATDACPDQAGSPSANVRRNGCPGLVVIRLDRIVIERPVYFATGRDTILSRSRGILTALSDAMRLTPAIHRVSIVGHTDDVGSSESNRDLSERRARNVMQWLIEHGIEASRLEAHGLGESSPEASGHSREAREQNRQVEFLVTDPAPLAGSEGAPQ